MSKFKRATLAGSEELFRPTLRPRVVEEAEPEPPPAPAETRDLRLPLSRDEIQLLLDAIHAAKYPERARRLPLEKFERYDLLRDKLQEHLKGV